MRPASKAERHFPSTPRHTIFVRETPTDGYCERLPSVQVSVMIGAHEQGAADEPTRTPGVTLMISLTCSDGVNWGPAGGSAPEAVRSPPRRPWARSAPWPSDNAAVMPGGDVLDILAALERRDVRVWLDGGWGVDALLGSQHRVHDDLDLVLDLAAVPAVRRALQVLSFEVAEDHLPTRMVLRSEHGQQVDLHPVTFDAEGTGRQAAAAPDGSDCCYPAEGFTTGTILGRTVGCLTAEVQVEHHSGYDPRPHDRDDMDRLAQRFRVPLPDTLAR
jgi:lincosamide nucleotidyltransferase A/C/D/E